MSHTSVKHSSSTREQLSLDDFLGLGLKLLAISIENLRTVTQQTQAMLLKMPNLASLRPQCPCAIPEVECPPRCVCEVTWEAIPGEALALMVRVTNSSRIRRTFNLAAIPFAGPGAPGSISLTPTTLNLAAGQTGNINATFTVPAGTVHGDYYAEIIVRNALELYEQAVCVTLQVGCKKMCDDECCTCHVMQGDPPKRIRAHQWYHHFQCTEDCFIRQD